MDAAGIAERTRPPATAEANGRAPEPHPLADPTMTRAAREARAAWRRAAPEAWRCELEALYYYTPEYPYDPGHEYEPDWTTDPDYGIDGLHRCRFDADGIRIMADIRAREIQRTARNTTFDKLGDCVEVETSVHYLAPDNVVRWVLPDLMVLPQVGLLGMATSPDRALRLDQGAPPPALILEILSYGGLQRDLEDKRQLYADLGVREYLVYDLGGKRRRRSPRELLLYRLEGGLYHKVDPAPKETALDPDVHWSDVFSAYIRMMPDPQEKFSELPEEQRPPPRFQWWDEEQERWRDRQTDAEHEQDRVVQERDRVAQERDQAVQERDQAAQERDQAAQERNRLVDLLHQLLPAQLDADLRARIIARWQEDGPPTDAVARILAVREAPDAWRTLLLPDEFDDDHGPDHLTPPRKPSSP